MISNYLKCVFIHIPKCAGSSINIDLKLESIGFSGHSPASCHFDYINHEYFSFTFIRNPYDRLVSAYKYFKKLAPGHRWYKRNSIIADSASNMDFEEFANHVTDFQKLMVRQDGSFESGIHFQPFSYFLDDEIEYIGRFETIQHDYFSIRSRLNLPIKSLPKTNSTQNRNYKELYTEKTKHIVYNIYKEDIKKYNYEF